MVAEEMNTANLGPICSGMYKKIFQYKQDKIREIDILWKNYISIYVLHSPCSPFSHYSVCGKVMFIYMCLQFIPLYSSQLPRDSDPALVMAPAMPPTTRVAGACTQSHMTISRIDAADETVK